MKTFYFIRHAESESNVAGTYLGAAAKLTENGKQQARTVAKRATKLDFDSIVVSKYPRAVATAQAIADATGKPLNYFEDLHERDYPSSIIGKPAGDPEATATLAAMYDELKSGRGGKVDDEEHYEDLYERAGRVREFLESYPDDRVVVVTHGTFMRFFNAYLMLDTELTPALAHLLMYAHETYNTGITVYEYTPEPKHHWHRQWVLRTWMDRAHLAE
jgi:broad specificity phosphatase PhoE